MSVKPILFNTDMVRAILDNHKTVTRRAVKGVSAGWEFVGIEERPYELRTKADGTEYPKELDWPHAVFSAGDGFYDYPMRKAPYPPGDILWVRETWGDYSECQPGGAGYYLYRADYPDGAKTDTSWDGVVYDLPRWHPSIHMPREAARIFLRVTDVRVERLQDITEDQAKAEGAYEVPWAFEVGDVDGKIKSGPMQTAVQNFAGIWDSTIKKADRALYGWEANPWVWVIEFERVGREEALAHDA